MRSLKLFLRSILQLTLVRANVHSVAVGVQRNMLPLFAATMLLITTEGSGQIPELWGTGRNGGLGGGGVMFKINGDGSGYTHIVDFDVFSGKYPVTHLTMAPDHKLYGVTNGSGGTVFSYDTATAILTAVHYMSWSDGNGYNSFSGLCLGPDAKLYGTTLQGGTTNDGVLYCYDPATSQYTKVHDFGGVDGHGGYSSPIVAADGLLYGSALDGPSGKGVLYRYDPLNAVYTKIYDFNGTDGENPNGDLFLAQDQKLYGTTSYGGAHGHGVLFNFDPADSVFTKLFDFDSTGGIEPFGGVIQASDGKLYGTTTVGGTHNLGTLFSFDIGSLTYTTLFDFDGLNGQLPGGARLMQASDGKLYGSVPDGGIINSVGVLFSYDINLNAYQKIFDFDQSITTSIIGGRPEGGLLEVRTVTVGMKKIMEDGFSLYPNPASEKITLHLLKKQKVVLIDLEDMNGRRIKTGQLMPDYTSIMDVSDLDNGIYFLHVQTEGKSCVKKIVVQH